MNDTRPQAPIYPAWPKFKVTTRDRETIMDRAEAEALDLQLMKASRLSQWDQKYATAEEVSKSFDQLAAGHVVSFEPLGSYTSFSRYTRDDATRDAASELLEALREMVTEARERNRAAGETVFNPAALECGLAAIAKAEGQHL